VDHAQLRTTLFGESSSVLPIADLTHWIERQAHEDWTAATIAHPALGEARREADVSLVPIRCHNQDRARLPRQPKDLLPPYAREGLAPGTEEALRRDLAEVPWSPSWTTLVWRVAEEVYRIAIPFGHRLH
jgi:hypothetical protein